MWPHSLATTASCEQSRLCAGGLWRSPSACKSTQGVGRDGRNWEEKGMNVIETRAGTGYEVGKGAVPAAVALLISSPHSKP